MTRVRAWLDTTPLASLALALMREATGQPDPVAVLTPARPGRLDGHARIGVWSMAAGAGASTVAALLAQRAGAGGRPPLLVDLDRWTPSLAIRASIEAATITDVLVQPEHERELLSRWGSVPFVPGSPELHRQFDGERVVAALERLADGLPLVVDLGSGPDALDPVLTARLTRLLLVCGTSASQLQAAFCSRALLAHVRPPAGLVLVGAERDDASLIARRVGLPLLAAIPEDAYLARDEFAARAPTMRAIDSLIAAL